MYVHTYVRIHAAKHTSSVHAQDTISMVYTHMACTWLKCGAVQCKIFDLHTHVHYWLCQGAKGTNGAIGDTMKYQVCANEGV